MRNVVIIGALALGLAIGASACSATQSCDMRPKMQSCNEQIGKGTFNTVPGTGSTNDSICTNDGGKPGGGCDKKGSLGGCSRTEEILTLGADKNTTTYITWYYPNVSGGIQTSADVMKLCSSNQTYVTP